jgi:hypothetical protein
MMGVGAWGQKPPLLNQIELKVGAEADGVGEVAAGN